MSLTHRILQVPALWSLSQAVFGCDRQKRALYRSVMPEPGRLLDFGCANGNTFEAFTDFEYVGVDLDPRLIEHARERFSGYENARFVCADILKGDFDEGAFDYVLCATTGHHLDDPALHGIVNALAKALRPDGHLHFIDTIRAPGEESLLLRTLINMDQGKFMRSEGVYRELFASGRLNVEPVSMRTTHITGTLMPQPKYFVADLRRRG